MINRLPMSTGVHRIDRPEEIAGAEIIVFPGVGSFGSAMEVRSLKSVVGRLIGMGLSHDHAWPVHGHALLA